MAFREASMDSIMETTWRSLCLRMSPAAPIADEDDDEDDYVCTAFTNPTVDGVLAKSTATEQLTFRLLFLRLGFLAYGTHPSSPTPPSPTLKARGFGPCGAHAGFRTYLGSLPVHALCRRPQWAWYVTQAP